MLVPFLPNMKVYADVLLELAEVHFDLASSRSHVHVRDKQHSWAMGENKRSQGRTEHFSFFQLCFMTTWLRNFKKWNQKYDRACCYRDGVTKQSYSYQPEVVKQHPLKSQFNIILSWNKSISLRDVRKTIFPPLLLKVNKTKEIAACCNTPTLETPSLER